MVMFNSGYKMFMVGLGVWCVDFGVIYNVILEVIKIGYCYFDCVGN